MLKDLYEVKSTNGLFSLKSRILSIKMEENETIVSFISQIEELNKKLGDIGEVVSNTNLVTITINGMPDEYQMFITGLNAREKAPMFEELTGILMQEEERQLTHKPQSSDLALMARKNHFKGMPNAAEKRTATPRRMMPPHQGFPDSNWARNVDYRRSIRGYAFSIGSEVITWSSKKQNRVSLSSVEAEYQAMFATTCEADWLRRLLLNAVE
eukprot:PITA_17828